MLRYVSLDADGRILKFGLCSAEMLPLQSGIVKPVEADVNDTMHFWDGEKIAQRPEFAEAISGTTISNLPIPTTVLVGSQIYEVTDGEADLTFAHPGTYQVRLVSFPYVEKTVEVTQP